MPRFVVLPAGQLSCFCAISGQYVAGEPPSQNVSPAACISSPLTAVPGLKAVTMKPWLPDDLGRGVTDELEEVRVEERVVVVTLSNLVAVTVTFSTRTASVALMICVAVRVACSVTVYDEVMVVISTSWRWPTSAVARTESKQGTSRVINSIMMPSEQW